MKTTGYKHLLLKTYVIEFNESEPESLRSTQVVEVIAINEAEAYKKFFREYPHVRIDKILLKCSPIL